MTFERVSKGGSLDTIQKSPSWVNGLLVGVSLTASLALFFRYDIMSHFKTVIGDVFDGDIELSVLEHWFNVVRGLSAWTQTFAFYPATGTLGYNDGYLIYGLIYAIARSLNVDPYLSSELVNISIKSLGFVGFYLFSRRIMANTALFSCMGAAVFLLANNSYDQAGHAQLFTISFAPILANICYEMLSALAASRTATLALWAFAASALFAAWLLTAFYMAWFFTFFCGLCLIFALPVFPRRQWQTVVSQAMSQKYVLILAMGMQAILLVPFFILYLPRAAETGMHSSAEIKEFLLAPSDLLALGSHNLLYRNVLPSMQSGSSEHTTGFTPILLVCFILTACWAFRGHGDSTKRQLRPMILAVLTCWILALAIDGYSLWTVVYAIVPGAKALRVVCRIQIFLAWPVVTVSISGLDRLCSTASHVRRTATAVSALVALYIATEQINTLQLPTLDRGSQMRWLHSFAAPPGRCKAFFATNTRPPDERYGSALNNLVGFNIDSMLVAEWLSQPTVNGFATFVPPGWNLLAIDKYDYIGRVRHYGEQTGILPALCGLDLNTGNWTTAPFTD